MSAVGPRAERPEFVQQLERDWGLVKQGYGASKEDARVKLQEIVPEYTAQL